MLPENKEARSAMFECGGKRGTYPQVFIKDAAGAYTSVGDFDEVQSLNDTDSLPPDVLAANPTVKSTLCLSFTVFLICLYYLYALCRSRPSTKCSLTS